ncbi:MAG TPA: amino acid permease [Planctomycetota bacterium]|nr:amino acid permease [Planctomycetota bacterium]
MHSINERPRELRWYHAAGLLFGDWGTSRLYVLGIAFVASGHASFWYVAAMCALVTFVGFSYTVVCAHFPDGGGVYSSAKLRSRKLAVLGALLLIADYTITASLSAYEGFRYMLPGGVSSTVAWLLAIAAIIGMGVLNVFGPRRVGVAAMVVAITSGIFFLIIGVFCIPHLGKVVIHAPTEPPADQWKHFVNVILALSGVEAIANMTGVMAEPVARNARRAIFVVMAEVVILNLVFAYAMNALPALQGVDTADAKGIALTAQHDSPVTLVDESGTLISEEQHKDYADHMVKILAAGYVGEWFAVVASVFFGLLLLSAANTAIGAMISVQYLLARDKELPQVFTRLNNFGVPWVGLITATLIPAIVLAIVGPDSTMLAGLYAIGIVGAISIDLMACGTNFKLEFKIWERITLISVGTLTVVIWLTIAYQKWEALLFAVVIIGTGFTARAIAQRKPPPVPAPIPADLKPLAESAARPAIAASQARVLVPTRGHPKLLKFAANYAKDKKAAMFVLFVREIALAFRERGGKIGAETMTLANDKEAQAIFARAKQMCDEAGVPMIPLYAVSDSPADLILDHAATMGVDAVLMGVSQRGALWKTLRGDVLQEVIEYLPESIPLLIHA